MESKCVFGWLLLQMLMLRASFSFSTKERCPTLHTLTNGYMINYIYERSPFGHEVTFRCKDGYSIKGVSSVKCLRSRHNLLYWSDVVPLCQRTCNTNRLRNGQCIYDYSAATHGSRTCSCNGGFKMDGQPKGLCREASQSWSNNPKCTEISCSTLSNPTNGWVRVNSMTVGSVASFTCKDGYALAGRPSINCEQQGSQGIWSDQSPTCESISCSRPPSVTNGVFEGHVFRYLGVVRYSCDRGYCLNGNSQLICTENGTWSPQAPVCLRIVCPIPAEVANGSVVIQSRTVGGTVTLQCQRGFLMEGTPRSTCVRNSPTSCSASWDETLPRCKATDCGVLKAVSNGYQFVVRGNGRRYPSYVQHKCHAGYHLTGGTEFRQCLHTGQWSGKDSKCNPVYCGELVGPENGRMMRSNFTYRGVATFYCYRGYRMVGREAIKCLASGVWNDSVPSCRGTTCLPVKSLPNGRVVASGYAVGNVVAFSCTPGYILDGETKLTCVQSRNAHARWNNVIPICRAQQCNSPRTPANGFISGRKYTYPNVIAYGCNEGFVLAYGAEERQCNAAGTWTGIEPKCRRVNCFKPTVPNNGGIVGETFSYNDTVRFVCTRGYRLIGSRSTTCTTDGVWSSASPKCLRVLCDTPVAPINGRVLLSGNHYQHSARYVCLEGYMLLGSRQRVCQQLSSYATEGQWSGISPKCKAIRCTRPQAPLNGRIVGYKFYYPNSVRYMCDFGYTTSSGTAERNCTASGVWSGPPPSCESVCSTVSPPCSDTQVCIVNSGGRAQCTCKSPSTCTTDYNPVCGSDGRTYINECRLKATSCVSKRSDLVVSSIGECVFSCSVCDRFADCIENSHCRCKPGHFGDGKRCCSKDMGSQVTITGASAIFRCDSQCSVAYQSVTWYFNEEVVDVANKRYGLVNDGMLFYLENITKADAGEYTCEIQAGETTYRRHGTLELSDIENTNMQLSKLCAADCGRSCARSPFVARGDATYAGEFPWQVMLCSPPQGQHCGGVLVSSDCVVTAAHCVVDKGAQIKNISACVGRQCGNCSEKDAEGNPQCFQPRSIAVHPDFDRRTLDNDIAVMKLRRPVLCDCSSVIPVCLPNKTRDGQYIKARAKGIVTGWGRVNSTISRSTCLRKGHVRLASRRICASRHDNYPITDSMMCAADYNGACKGDSGGPLVVKNQQYGNRYVLTGIVSWGKGCGSGRKLGVYTAVLSHMEWIRKTCAIKNSK